MSIEIIDKLKQKNSGKFKLMDLEDVDYDGNETSTKEKIDSLPSKMIIDNDNKLYLQDSKGKNIGEGIDLATQRTYKFSIYDDETGESKILEVKSLDNFDYVEVED